MTVRRAALLGFAVLLAACGSAPEIRREPAVEEADRERQLKLELSNWTSRGGTAGAIKARFLGPTEFTLAPCEEREAVLVIEATPANQSGGQEGPTRIVIPDVDDCQVFYADLRVEGCEMRSLRIALALLPRDCAAHKVECGCDCC